MVCDSAMCCGRVAELCLLEKLLLNLLFIVMATVLLEHITLHRLLFNLLLFVRVSARQLLKDLPLHLHYW